MKKVIPVAVREDGVSSFVGLEFGDDCEQFSDLTEPSIGVGPPDMETNDINARVLPEPRSYKMPRSSIFNQPGLLAGMLLLLEFALLACTLWT